MIGSYPALTAVDVVGTTAYCTGKFGFVILDVSNSSQPVLLSQIPAISYSVASVDITVKGNYAYVAVYDGMLIVDVSHKANPRLLSKYEARGGWVDGCWRVTVSASTAYLSCSKGLRIVDVTSASAPRFLATCESLGDVQDAAVAGNTLYVADVGLWIYDLSNAPTLLPVNPLTPIDGTSAVHKKSDAVIIVVVVVGSVLVVAAGVGLYCYTRGRRSFSPQVADPADTEDSLSMGYESSTASLI
eukprot:TRINITY_DN1576_c0_g1_i1.p1 TRINITY_DN1576_c0_g1~~TRINITY_DN1576_c0_g1_i1.p1  ORF type:complete len:244 (+),score=30.67 TRINITY_DN1576_c0_g1_i1:3-734(+)